VELARAADATVLGRIVDASPGRVVHDKDAAAEGVDPRQADVFFVNLTVSVDDVLSGSSPSRTLTVEVLVPNFDLLGSLTKNYPSEPTIFFLRNVANAAKANGQSPAVVDSLRGLYRLCTQGALIRDSGGVVHSLDFSETEFLNNLGGKSFKETVDEVRTAGS
jgi:hypothetical protein